jgi:hypothetical protein
MAEKKLFDNLYKVIKANSGVLVNDGVATEILDLQIPRGYCAKIKKVRFIDHALTNNNESVDRFKINGALVLDPDDEESYQIPTFEVDHDVACDCEHEYCRMLVGAPVTDAFSVINNKETLVDFTEDLDVVTVRNVRYNVLATGLSTDPASTLQQHIEVYFTYEKISADLYSKLLGIS